MVLADGNYVQTCIYDGKTRCYYTNAATWLAGRPLSRSPFKIGAYDHYWFDSDPPSYVG